METFISDDGSIGKFIHDDGSETAVSRQIVQQFS